MRYIKTYEGFFGKLKKLIIPDEVPVKKIDTVDLEDTIKECFAELENSGFTINIESKKSNIYPRFFKGSKAHKAGIETTFGPERIIYEIVVDVPDKPPVINPEDNMDDDSDWQIYNGAGMNIAFNTSYFKVGDIKDSVLLLRDIMKSKFGLDISIEMTYNKSAKYHVDIEELSDDDELESCEIRFEIPL